MTTPDGDVVTHWHWWITGTGHRLSPGAMERGVVDEGVIDGEYAGDALATLLHHGDLWDQIDQNQPIELRLEPITAHEETENPK